MLEFKRDTWHGCFLQNITVWIDYLSRTNPSHRSFFPMLSLLMLWLVNALCNLLLNYWVLSSFYYVWLICIHLSIFISSFALYLGVITRIYSFFILTQGIKQNPQLSCFSFLIISYPTHYFTFGIVLCMCAGYRVGTSTHTKHSLSLFLIKH